VTEYPQPACIGDAPLDQQIDAGHRIFERPADHAFAVADSLFQGVAIATAAAGIGYQHRIPALGQSELSAVETVGRNRAAPCSDRRSRTERSAAAFSPAHRAKRSRE
jgi:hypothetical protein